MFRYLCSVFLILVATQLIIGQNPNDKCKAITDPTNILDFGSQWQEYVQYIKSGSTTPLLVKGNTNGSLSLSNTLSFNAATTITQSGVSVQSPATGYRVCNNYELPAFVGDMKVIYSLRRNFIKGFYKINLSIGDNINELACFYGVGSSPNIPLTTALNNLGTPINGIDNALIVNSSTKVLEKIVYLEGEMNFLVYSSGRLVSIDPNNLAGVKLNSFNCIITPLNAPEQACEHYIPVVNTAKSICGLGTLSMEVLDKESDYFFFYKTTPTSAYQIYPGILKPNVSRIISIPQIPYVDNSIPIWGVIRSIDGCTFYETTKPIVFEDSRFQINANAITVIPPTQCGSQTVQLKIPISPLVNTGQLKNGDYEIVLFGTTGSTPSFLKSVVELSTTNDFVVSNIPLNFVVNKITITHTTTTCSAISNGFYSFQPSTLPNITITKNNNPEACNTTLTLAGIDAFPCGKIVWYKREATALQDEQIATSHSITVAPIVNTIYKAKFYLYDQVFEVTKDINAVVTPLIYDIAFSSNPFINNSGIGLSILPMSNVDINNCNCTYQITDMNGMGILLIDECNPQNITFGASGNYIVNLTINDGKCIVKTSKILVVIDPVNPVFQNTIPNIDIDKPYTTTKNLLDEAYFIKKSPDENNPDKTWLHFQYHQEYIPTLSNNEMQVRLYDWQRNIVAFSQIPRVHGIQWYALPIPNDISKISGSFVLELTDDNGWIQKLRVKNRFFDLSCGEITPASDEYCLLSNKGFTLKDIVGGQAPYQVKCRLYDQDDKLIEEKTVSTQTSFCTYIPTINLLSQGNKYRLEMKAIDACGASCEKEKRFYTENCFSQRTSVNEEVPKVEIKINVLPQNPTNPSTPIIKN